MPNVDRNLYFNNLTGEYEEGYRDPVTHVIHFGGDDAPDATDAALAKASELSISLGDVEGTGKDGRVTVSDVQKHADSLQEAAPEPAEGSTPSEGDGGAQSGTQTSQAASNGEVDEEEARRQAEEAAARQVNGDQQS